MNALSNTYLFELAANKKVYFASVEGKYVLGSWSRESNIFH